MIERAPLPPPKYEALNAALLGRIEQLVKGWLPGGKKEGKEYKCGSLSGGKGDSCSVNVTGKEGLGCWADFATGEKGGDLISLYGAIHGLGNVMAAVTLAREEGLEDIAGVTLAHGDATVLVKPPRPEPPKVAPEKPDEKWEVMAPVPDFAPLFRFHHSHYDQSNIEHVAEYRMDSALYGYIVRVMRSQGGKLPLPFTWCKSDRDGSMKWLNKTFAEPRPLYFPSKKSPVEFSGDLGQPLATVVLVEGEKKAGILQDLLDAYAPGIYLVCSWPGGSNAWKKANWSWLAGCSVLLWPDCDAHREKLTPKERAACPDDLARAVLEQSKPLLPVTKQPGMAAMLGIGAILRDTHGCSVQLLPIPQPLEVPAGWDCADAITTDGWDGARVLAFFGQSQPLPSGNTEEAKSAHPGKPAAPFGGDKGGNFGAAPANAMGAGGINDAFTDHLAFLCDKLDCEVHELGVNRKLLIAALRKAPDLKDCLGFNELTGAPGTRVPWPWRAVAGPLKDTDDLGLGDYLCSTYKLKAASRAALSEAIETVADQNRYHPIKDYLHDQVHDDKPRLDRWLIYVLGMDPATMSPRRKRYLELVGRYLLIGLVARVMDPGCKFDYSPVFEGLPGVGKSTFVKTLVGAEFFSDTHFDIGNGKDGFEQLEGLWGYELSELTALRKADSEQVKQFFSSTVDRFRGAYGKYVQAHPRQCVIFCSTNKKQYLYDLTGNRRFWPIWIDQQIKLEWLQKWRSQLFAEALKAYLAHERYAPTREEEEAYFEPEQKLRLVETAVQSRLYELLTREGAPASESKVTNDLNQHTTFITLDRLVSALGADAAKSSSLLESQIRGWLEAHGWGYGRESTGQRRRGYKQPSVWPPAIDEEEGASAPPTPPNAGGENEGSDDEPF
ncbi:MAG: virulence protein E [Rhodoferax sp.]|nr:virulence protein E [Rhodoferax sp.]